MENNLSRRSRIFRSKVQVLDLLREQQQSGLSIQAFCTQRSIPSGSFHNWKKKYGSGDGLLAAPSFAPVQITPSMSLFAEVGGIKLFQPVSAAFLKQLLP